MIYLLDTHSFIWSITDSNKLSPKANKIISDINNEICISVISFWEISIKTAIKKFVFDNIDIKDFPKYAQQLNLNIINLEENDAVSFYKLPLKTNHKDPFDRMLIWQAINADMPLISKDCLFEQYKKDGLKLVW
jgi:PIN domain nuclease of toxin-antitoxin system